MKVWKRVKFEWRRKLALGSTLFFTFWTGYFFIPPLSPFPPFEIPSTIIDRALPLLPEATWAYALQFLATPLLGWFMSTGEEVTRYFAKHFSLVGLTFLFFFFTPTYLPPFATHVDESSLYSLIKSIDTNFNACPSLHAGYATLFVGGLREIDLNGRKRVAIGGVIYLSAVLGALLTKQHRVIDILCGSLLGIGITVWFGCRGRINQ